ncbi:uncharacterized protein LOC116343597 [Contarinia nasturtii]|uniref:uncharacterized protein LOC116343597 n=1 Tax=Contarinia nasturtii TaxID=265458 RepID=UPI0012D4C0CB|nr:uncharacterized protein LOC116343597 [Contarinia nasturtii]
MIFLRSRGEELPTWLLLALCFFLSHQRIYGLDKEIIDDLTIPNRNFGFKTMNYFINLVNAKKPHLQMINITDKNTVQNYNKCNTDYDLQIIYSNQMGLDSGVNYVTIESRIVYKSRCVYVYDSLGRFELNEQQKQIIDLRYPQNSIYLNHPSTRQLSGPASGPLSIAYATLFASGEDPRRYPLRMNMSNPDPTVELRRHILSMFESNELTIFPKADSEGPTQFSSQIMKELGSPKEPFSDATINYFIQMVRLQKKFDMINLNNYNKAYQKADPKQRDIQILYGNGTSNGYYICVFYEPSVKKVYVYDILLPNKLSPRNKEIIKERYPERIEIVFAKPSKDQKEKTKELEKNVAQGILFGRLRQIFKDKTEGKEIARISSGPMSIAYAASLIYLSSKRHFLPCYRHFRSRESISDLQLDRINLDEPIGDSPYYDLRKSILNLFQSNLLYRETVHGTYISNKPPPKTSYHSYSSSSSSSSSGLRPIDFLWY